VDNLLNQYGSMLAGATVWGYLALFLFLVFLILWAIRFLKGKGKAKDNSDLPMDDDSYESISEDVKAPKKKIILGTGECKCLCFRTIKGVNIADFTTIPKPIGEQYQFDPSCPVSGWGSIVKEDKDGNIVDYDPREVTYDLKKSPEYAYFATVWDICKRVFYVPIPAWKSSAMWFAAAMLAITFITGLVVFD